MYNYYIAHPSRVGGIHCKIFLYHKGTRVPVTEKENDPRSFLPNLER
jgi:hypothetical protein